MSLRSNFARFLKLPSRWLRRYRNNDIAQGKWHYQRRFHSLITRHGDLDLVKGISRNLGPATFSRASSLKIRETRTARPSDMLEYKRKMEPDEYLGYTRQAISIMMRIMIVGSVVIALIVAYLITRLTHAALFPIILRKGIESLGPIFIKFGQWISTRRDMFPRDVCDTLSRLQQNTTTHSWQYTKRLLENTYGPSWRDLFVRFDDETLIGSGCCAQVYKAWINLDTANSLAERERHQSQFMENETSGDRDTFDSSHANRNLQAVAIKVLHPGIKDQLKRDIAIMRGLCKCAMYFIPELHWLSPVDCVDEFARMMENQIDMRLEAINLAKFSANFSRRSDVTFPYPYTHLTHRKILVESFHDGSPISSYIGHGDPALQRKLAKIGIAVMLQMVFKDNFIHCDLHPGNVLVERTTAPRTGLLNTFRRVITPDYVATEPRLIILDCGLVVSLDDRCRRNLRDVFYSVLMGNAELAAQYMLAHSWHETSDRNGFERSMRNIVNSHLRSPLNVNVGTVVTELFSAMVRHRIKQDGSFSNVILSMLVIEGLGRCLDPNIDIFTEILPFVLSTV